MDEINKLMQITDINNSETIKPLKFSGGELHIQLKYKYKNPEIIARIQSSDDLISLALVKEILDRNKSGKVSVVIPYFPYARQDRVTEKNTNFSLKTITNMINSLNFDTVTVYDPHSDVTPALINNMEVVKQYDIISDFQIFNGFVDNNTLIVAPDAGAQKKTSDVCKVLKNNNLFVAEKHRDVLTGNITSMSINIPKSQSVLVVDDICDGGKTFIELAKLIKPKTEKLMLYVTHGIFSKGLDELFEYYDLIFTTNTFSTNHKHPSLLITNII